MKNHPANAKIISLVSFLLMLALLLCTGTLCQSCGSEKSGEETSAPQTRDTTTPAAETDYLDTLGEKDFGIHTFPFISSGRAGPAFLLVVPARFRNQI